MDLQLQGKHILITGGSKGIGLSCARGFLAEGARVALVDQDQEGLGQVAAALEAAGSPVLTLPADVTSDAAARAGVERVLATPLDDQETRWLEQSASTLHSSLRELGLE